MKQIYITIRIFGLLLLASCSQSIPSPQGILKVVSTTTILGDVVDSVGGTFIDHTVLVPPGLDPHSFEPSPKDISAIADADIIFVNGFGLEGFLQSVIINASDQANIVSVSEGVEGIEVDDGHYNNDRVEGQGLESDRETIDPHVWMDPNNVVVWVDNIASALSDADPDNESHYEANAVAYKTQLHELDEWIREEVATLSEGNRRLVTDHETLRYFAAQYDFTIIGAVIPGYSPLSETTASDLAELEEAVLDYAVPAIFLGQAVNSDLATQLAADTGIQLVLIYTGSLSDEDGPAASYIDMMRYDVEAIVGVLR